jgi:Sortase domain
VSAPGAIGGRGGWGRRPILAAVFVVLLIGLLISKLAGGGPGPVAPAQAGAVANPSDIRIPAIGVSARVIPLALHSDGTLAAPRDYGEAGWYAAGPEPGEPGPSVVAGHVDSKRGPGVFFKLPRLRRGDVIYVDREDGSTVGFSVDRLEQWPKASFPTGRVYGRTKHPALRLVTCSGDFDRRTGHYTSNTIVFASQR